MALEFDLCLGDELKNRSAFLRKTQYRINLDSRLGVEVKTDVRYYRDEGITGVKHIIAIPVFKTPTMLHCNKPIGFDLSFVHTSDIQTDYLQCCCLSPVYQRISPPL